MIAFKILILFLTPFVAGCCRALCFILANANCATTEHGLPSCGATAILPASRRAVLNGQDVPLGPTAQDGCATNAKKARPTDATWPLDQSLPRWDCESGGYLWYAGAGSGATSFFCAQAPKVKALAKTVIIMIAFKILILFLTPFVAGCCRALYKRTQTAQRFSPPPTITR